MHLKSLKVFCDVVRLRSFSRAAEENEISQSGASQVVNQLEQRLGVRLIDRSKRPFVLTPEGEAYYDGCRGLVERYFVLEDKVRTLHHEVAGRLRVASIYSVGLHHMSRYLKEFLSRHPKANVRLEYLHPHRVYDAVERDKADLGLVSYPKSSRTVLAIEWRTEPMILACSPEHRLANEASIELAQLAGEALVGFDEGLTIRREIDRALHLADVEVSTVMEFDNIETIKRAVEVGTGVALLPEPTVQREVAAGSLKAVPLATEELVRPLGIIYRRGRELASVAERFIELLRRESSVDEPIALDGREHHAAGNGHVAANVNGDSATEGTTSSLADHAPEFNGASDTSHPSTGDARTARTALRFPAAMRS
ncbi:MAG: LysR family transcriptional regulator [Planctomycetia bacterium]|nr:LysR family transcriptional regulator [Planctomycetia bacterium]